MIRRQSKSSREARQDWEISRSGLDQSRHDHLAGGRGTETWGRPRGAAVHVQVGTPSRYIQHTVRTGDSGTIASHHSMFGLDELCVWRGRNSTTSTGIMRRCVV